MRLHVLLILTAGLTLAAAPADDAPKEREKLKGTWNVVSAESDGEKSPEEEVKKVKVTFADDKMLVKEGDKTIPASFTLDPGKKPPAIDITATEGNQKDKVMLGIYELNGDDLKLCLSRPGKEQRPGEFATKAGSETMLIILKRDKP